MRVSKQKGRLPYHGIFCPDHLFFRPSKAVLLIQRINPHLGTFVFRMQPRWGQWQETTGENYSWTRPSAVRTDGGQDVLLPWGTSGCCWVKAVGVWASGVRDASHLVAKESGRTWNHLLSTDEMPNISGKPAGRSHLNKPHLCCPPGWAGCPGLLETSQV